MHERITPARRQKARDIYKRYYNNLVNTKGVSKAFQNWLGGNDGGGYEDFKNAITKQYSRNTYMGLSNG